MSSLSLRASIATAVLLAGLGGCTAQAATGGPSIVSIDPNNGAAAGGTLVTIEGSGFAAGATVAFGATPASSVKVLSATTIVAMAPAGSGLVGIRVSAGTAPSTSTPADRFAYDPPPAAHWLGLNGNGDTELGPIDRFERAGIVYDRSGPIDWIAGELPERGGRPTPGGRALSRDYGAGMTPVVTIEYGGYEGEYEPDPHFPGVRGGSKSLERYVEGFVASAKAILRAHPGRRVLFEAMNEPWGYTTPQFDGAQYAAVVAKLLPAARRAGIPLQDVYVAATGRRWIAQMYRARPQLQTEVEGWYLHPYGPPNGVAGESSEGIQSLPQLQAEMTSGQNNLIVSELGYCARNVNGGRGCGSPSTATGEEAARDLTKALENAVPYHRAGWLRVLLVYSRSAGGWAMQFPDGRLTAQGRALLAFQARLPSSAFTSGFGGLGVRLPCFFAE